jgi:DNA-directed RNA polymerase specialized sigma24 family protein
MPSRLPLCGQVTNRVKSSCKKHDEKGATLRHELLLEARTCSEPFGVFYDPHFASVLVFFRRRVPGPEEAFDLAAETFAAALASVPRFQPGPEAPQAWLFAIARYREVDRSIALERAHA